MFITEHERLQFALPDLFLGGAAEKAGVWQRQRDVCKSMSPHETAMSRLSGRDGTSGRVYR
jgi:hypothetical protein